MKVTLSLQEVCGDDKDEEGQEQSSSLQSRQKRKTKSRCVKLPHRPRTMEILLQSSPASGVYDCSSGEQWRLSQGSQLGGRGGGGLRGFAMLSVHTAARRSPEVRTAPWPWTQKPSKNFGKSWKKELRLAPPKAALKFPRRSRGSATGAPGRGDFGFVAGVLALWWLPAAPPLALLPVPPFPNASIAIMVG